MTLLNVCILLLSHGKELLLLVISDTSNTETPKKEKKTYTVEEIAEQLCVSKKWLTHWLKVDSSLMFVLVEPYGYLRILSING